MRAKLMVMAVVASATLTLMAPLAGASNLLPTAALPGASGINVVVNADQPAGRLNPDLTGANWQPGAGPYLAALHSRFTRLDVRLDLLFPHPPPAGVAAADAAMDPQAVSRFDAALDQIFAAGLQPIAILNSPAWLACCPDLLGDGTRQPPGDPAAYQALVARVVARFSAARVSSGRHPVVYWEVWNEPDYPGFYRGTLPQFLVDVLAPSDQAVQSVARASGISLQFGACGCLFPDPSWMIPIFAFVRAEGLPLGFISWHYYGNYPFVGPEGPEPSWPTIIAGEPPGFPVYNLLAHPNPLASPTTFSAGVDLVRSWAQVGLGRIPTLILDEWNLSAAGFDDRMDTNSGAAFDAGVLTELQHSGLDAAVVFASVDPYWDNKQANPTGADEFGSWGLVTHGGLRKPAWWAFDLFGEVGPDLIAAATPGSIPLADGVRVMAGRSTGATTVLMSSWLATGGTDRPVHLVVSGLGSGHSSASLYVIDARHSSAGSPVAVMSITDSLDFVLPAQSVILVRIIPTR